MQIFGYFIPIGSEIVCFICATLLFSMGYFIGELVVYLSAIYSAVLFFDARRRMQNVFVKALMLVRSNHSLILLKIN